jgi:hypothetical protein
MSFCVKAAAADHFSDMSLAVIKLMDRGSMFSSASATRTGHFGLAMQNYYPRLPIGASMISSRNAT